MLIWKAAQLDDRKAFAVSCLFVCYKFQESNFTPKNPILLQKMRYDIYWYCVFFFVIFSLTQINKLNVTIFKNNEKTT